MFICLFISILLLYIYPHIIINETITDIFKTILLGVFLGTVLIKIQNIKSFNGDVFIFSYEGLLLSFVLITKYDYIVLNLISYITILICSFLLLNILTKILKNISKHKSLIIDILAITISSIALLFQILDFIN